MCAIFFFWFLLFGGRGGHLHAGGQNVYRDFIIVGELLGNLWLLLRFHDALAPVFGYNEKKKLKVKYLEGGFLQRKSQRMYLWSI